MGKKGESKSKQLRWSKPMERVLLETLSDEVRNGERPNNSFKVTSLSKVAKIITTKFGVECSSEHVEHHLRTVRSSWSIIDQLRNHTTGLGWDDNLKMITASSAVYNEHVKAHPTHEKYLNKKIEMYDEMTLVVGKDRARGNFAKSFTDINLEARPQLDVHVDDDIDVEEVAKENEVGKQAGSSSATSSQSRQHRKRNRASYSDDEQLTKISDKLGEVAAALGKLAEGFVVNNLYEEVMKAEGFEDS